MRIKLIVGDLELTATLYDKPASKAVYEALPMEHTFNRWGDEFYFSIPVEIADPPERDVMEVGELAIWPPGNAFCIFYGRTPASNDDRPRAADPAIPFGKIDEGAESLKNAKGSKIRIERLENR